MACILTLIIINFYPETMNYHSNKDCIDACLQCAAVCHHCATEDLKENHGMARCVQLNMECAAICTAAAQLMSLGSEQALAICKLCAEICRKCAGECGKHNMQHCRECAEACKKCAELCSKL
jgi:hypothetical protein